jgi:hypothetical protein
MPSASSPVPSNAPTNPDAMIPTVVTDFVFDLFDSVTLSQKPEEQQHLYEHVFPDLSKSYFGSQQSWPSVQAMASECNGNPLFLALYRELAHRQQQYNRPTVRDRIEGFHVYKELFDEIILEHQEEYFLLPTWCFDILNEFLYQFQGYCTYRIHSATSLCTIESDHLVLYGSLTIYPLIISLTLSYPTLRPNSVGGSKQRAQTRTPQRRWNHQ